MATKHVSRVPQSIVEKIPLYIDTMLLPTDDGGFTVGQLAVDTVRFTSENATFDVNPIPMKRSHGPLFLDQLVDGQWRRYGIFRAASIISAGVDLLSLGSNAIAFSPDTMHLVLLKEAESRIGSYRRFGKQRAIKLTGVSIV